MCRIAGIWSLNKSSNYNINIKELIQQIRDTMKHGGPDDAGVFVDKNAQLALGHRRLTIIDLTSLGHQPMKYKDFCIVYNGEVYNFKEIKKELLAKGYKFKSNSDTEVVLKAFISWGPDCIHKFRGFFAFAIWDKRNERLYLFRDRIGVKPLYYYFKDNWLLFASEIKAFHKFPHFNKEIDMTALSFFFQYGYIPAPYSIFKYVKKVRPGHFLIINRRGIKEIKYWDIVDFYKKEENKIEIFEAEKEIENLLIEGFKYRLVSDVPVGVFLSGGVDSSAVTALLQKNISTTLHTFTIGFKENEYDESIYAQRIAKYLETKHTELFCSIKDALEIIEKLPEIYDEPFGDSSAIPTFLISKLARNYVKVILSGDGGDELFAGYTKYEIVYKFYKIPYLLRKSLSFIFSLFSPEFVDNFSFLKKYYTNIREKFYKFRNMLDGRDIEEMFCLSGSYASFGIIEKLLETNKYKYIFKFPLMEKIPDDEIISYMQMVDIKTYLPDDIMAKVDRASMANSLETREPFLDNKLIEYLMSLPFNIKYRKGKGKWILKRILYKYLPPKLLDRPKKGFEIPIYKWLKEFILKEYNYDFSRDFLKRQGILNPDFVVSLINNFLSGKYVNPHFLWFIFIFQRWYNKWIKS